MFEPERSAGEVNLLDLLPRQASGEPALETATLAVDAGARQGALAAHATLAAWCLVLQRLHGGPVVRLDLPGRLVCVDVPVRGALRDLVAAVNSALAGDPRANAPGARTGVAWSELQQSPAPEQLESLPGEIWLEAALLRGATSLTRGDSSDAQPHGEAAPALRLRYRSPALSAQAAQYLLHAWHRGVLALVGAPDSDIAAFDLITPAERQALRCALVSAPWSYRGPLSVAARFDEVAAAHADAVSVRWHGGHWTYADLDREAWRVCAHLRELGVAAGEVVGMGLARSPAALAAMLGVLRVGAAYLPVDLTYPRERLRFMCADAGVRLLLIERAGIAADLGVREVGVESMPAAAPRRDSASAVGDDALAYVMYTSGSTGRPKGVEIRHRSIVRLVGKSGFMTLNERTTVLQAAPLGFDASTLEIWGPLLNGGCCALHDEEVPTGRGLARSIATHGVHAAWLTASLFNAVVDDDARCLAGLTELLIGGEPLSVEHVRRFMAAVPSTQLINGYGPTETTTFAATHRITSTDVEAGSSAASIASIPIGGPIDETSLYILNRRLQPLPTGFVGELFIGGLGVARGYLGRPDLTAERFLADPFSAQPGATMYRTGDLVRLLDSGRVEFIGRADQQVKIRGFRIETGEVEAALQTHPAVRACAVVAHRDAARGTQLVAYVVGRSGAEAQAEPTVLRSFLAERLPEFMVPSQWMRIDALPITVNGKLDRRALPLPRSERPAHLRQPYVEPQHGAEREVAGVLAELIGVDRVGALDNIFDLGAHSLLVVRALAQLQRRAGFAALGVADIFAAPTPRGIAAAAAQAVRRAPAATPPSASRGGTHAAGHAVEPIAIVGMAGRFPGAPDIESFWTLLDEGREAIRFFRDDEIDASVPRELRADAQYVRARGVVDGIDLFDAGFFGITAREAELMDPQQRVFLELAWECLERAGQVPSKTASPIGVFAGMYNASYFQRHVLAHPDRVARLGEFVVMLANEKDYIATRAAHKLDLTGPAVSVHTACSTSLVAIAQAVEALRAGQCRAALAGGVSITCPPASGYLAQEGSMLSPDGHTRTFDAAAQGTVFSDGAAVVLLKRLSDAIADGNTIHAVIRGVAVNNDGADKASFTAPSVVGQAAVIESALDQAGVDARSLSFVEAHGTATPLGDPVEIAALTRAFRRHTAEAGFCAVGSLKSNTGHMVIAAGAAGVIKTALALTHERLPGTVHFERPNPKIDFAGSPFVVQAKAGPWPRVAVAPRRAGVSSFGVGGTNAHAVLEEAPPLPVRAAVPGVHLLRLSARTPAALAQSVDALATHLQAQPQIDLADVAHTLAVGRHDFAERTFVSASSAAEAVAALHDPQRAGAHMRTLPAAEPAPVLMFPGQGAQYAGMGRELHAQMPVFRAALDECFAALQGGHTPFDLRALMFGDAAAPLAQTAVTQPATFAIEYALARTWLAAGIEPVAMLGHSVGEFVAAVVAGVMSLADGIRLVAKRGALLQALPPGAMLGVRLAAAEVERELPADVQLAADNGPQACVLAGAAKAIDMLAAAFEARGVVVRRLQTSHAFHSAMMEPAVPAFEAAVRSVPLSPPQRRIVSTLTGRTLEAAEATSPAYWARHLRQPVRFAPAVRALLAEPSAPLFIEAGPRATLATLVRQQRLAGGTGVAGGVPQAVASLADRPDAEAAALSDAAGQLWTLGAEVNWPVQPYADRRRIVLPTYPFERKRHWVEAAPAAIPAAAPTDAPAAAVLPATAPVAQPSTSASSNNSMPIATVAAPEAKRRTALVGRLRTLFEEVSGVELDTVDADTAFVEAGLDSLTLTQVALQLKREFSLPITFRQLMEGQRSLGALASFLDEKLPAETSAPTSPASQAAQGTPMALPALPIAPLGGESASLVQQVIQQQMVLMAQQLALLQGQQGQAGAAVPAAVQMVTSSVPQTATAAATPTAADEEAALAHRSYDVKKAFGAIARIHTSGTEISERQRARLGAFMRRYIEKTQRSKAYTAEHRPHLADPRVVNGFRPQLKEIIYQIVIDRSKGAHLWDIDGNEYVDALNGFGMSLFGWQPDFVLEAVRKQLDSGYDIGPQHPLAGEVTRLTCELTGFDRAGLCNTGSEAVMGCMRIARTVTGRARIAVFAGAYHGIFDEVIVRGTKKLKAVPAAPGIMASTAENIVVLEYGTPESLQWLRANAGELAAVLVEPVQSRRPDLQPREFLRELRMLTQHSGTLLVFDEVVTGFRSHPGGVQALFDIRADLASYGKVMGGGFPIGVIAGKREYMDALDGGHWEYGDDSVPTVGVTYFAGTFVRHPLALVAAKAVLEHLKREGPELQANLTRRTAAMVDELNAWCRQAGAPITLKGFSSVWKIFFDEDHPLQDLLFAMMRNRGVHILDNFPCFMTTAHTVHDIALIKTAFKEAVTELQASEFLPAPKPALATRAFDASRPPVPGARLGRDASGNPAWFVANPDAPGKYVKVEVR